ncbi:hypothetical protein OBB00_09170 [Gammaproteobacteria bacterium]|nr:hypothetical protein [Gammaproteobacteria bacterium]
MSIEAIHSVAQLAITSAFFIAIALMILLALIKIEDVFNYADLRRYPITNLLKGEDDFRERVSRLVNVYRALAKLAVIALLISSVIAIGIYPASFLFQMPLSFESTPLSMPLEGSLLMFIVLALLLLVLLMKIETIWVFTIIETKGWDHRSQEADALEQRMEKRMNIAMNATAVCVMLIPITVLALVLRLAGFWD